MKPWFVCVVDTEEVKRTVKPGHYTEIAATIRRVIERGDPGVRRVQRFGDCRDEIATRVGCWVAVVGNCACSFGSSPCIGGDEFVVVEQYTAIRRREPGMCNVSLRYVIANRCIRERPRITIRMGLLV